MLIAAIAVACLIACEALLRLPLKTHFIGMSQSLNKSLRLIRSSRISDEKKEKMVPYYSLLLAKHSLLSFVYLLLAFLPFFVIGFWLKGGLIEISRIMLKMEVLIAVCIGAMSYMFIRKRIVRGRG